MTFEEEMQKCINFFNGYYGKKAEPTITVEKWHVLYTKRWHNWRRKIIVHKWLTGWDERVENDD